MLNIKEIALKIAEEMPSGFLWYEGCGHEAGILIEEAVDFAEALVAEIAKQNEPVESQYKGSDGSWKSFDSKDHESNTRNSGDWEVRDLFTFPPTAEQIANETAEAIAKFVAFQRNDIPATGIEFAEVIRSGAWKGFKK